MGLEDFVGREQELEDIHAALTGDGSRRTVFLNGLGGIGKTQLAVAYAKRQKDSYSAIFWLDARDETHIKQSFGKIAKRILRYHPTARYLSDIDLTGNLDDLLQAVNAWLSEPDNRRWLVVCDNYDNPQVPGNNDLNAIEIRRYLPDAYQGFLIITTRSTQVRFGKSIAVRKLTNVQESVRILSNMSRRTFSADGRRDVTLPVQN